MGGASGFEALKWLQAYKKLSAKPQDQLSPAEVAQLKDLEKKISVLMDPGISGKGPPQRASIRVPTQLEVVVRDAQDMKRLFIKNISGGGVYIETPHSPSVGTRLNLDLALPGHSKLVQSLVEVTWTNPKGVDNLKPGMGVKFISLPEDARKTIQRLIHEKVEEKIQDQNKKS